jgi:16S rRNA C1402 N4-methylase RsmH
MCILLTKPSDKLWRVTANLEVREMDVLSEASLDIILGDIGVSIPQIQQMAKVLGDLVNIDLIDAW